MAMGPDHRDRFDISGYSHFFGFEAPLEGGSNLEYVEKSPLGRAGMAIAKMLPARSPFKSLVRNLLVSSLRKRSVTGGDDTVSN